MKPKDRNSLTALLNQTKDHFQDISRHIHWEAADTERLDDLMNTNGLRKEIFNKVLRVTGSSLAAEIVPSLLVYKAWQRTKAVYSFNRVLVDDIAQTQDTSLHISLLERLPFRDMLFFFPEGVLPKPKDEDTAGIYVHLENHDGQMWTIISYFDRKSEDGTQVFPGMNCAFSITDGMKISAIFETPQFLRFLAAYKLIVTDDLDLSEQEAEERLSIEKKTLNIFVSLMYYLASKNADIKPVKLQKKPHKSSSKKENIPAVNLHEVGTEYAEVVYRYLKENPLPNEDVEDKSNENNETDETLTETVKPQKKKRPHVRRAHWNHYWTGEGRATLEARWIPDLFVGTNRDDQATIVYEPLKESLKGKQNPNSSKKNKAKQVTGKKA